MTVIINRHGTVSRNNHVSGLYVVLMISEGKVRGSSLKVTQSMLGETLLSLPLHGPSTASIRKGEENDAVLSSLP